MEVIIRLPWGGEAEAEGRSLEFSSRVRHPSSPVKPAVLPQLS